jgi:hypothetical protein
VKPAERSNRSYAISVGHEMWETKVVGRKYVLKIVGEQHVFFVLLR